MINNNFLQEANLLDMSKEIFNSVVDENLKVETRFQLLSSKIQDAETVNFILADGLGFLNLQSTDSFLNEYINCSINTTFPSSTNVALTTIATLKNPIEHGIFGYYMYDKLNYGLINALNWNSENKDLLQEDYFKSQSSVWNIFKESNIYASNFQPKNLINTPLSNFLYEEKSTVPYVSQEDLVISLSDSIFLENRFNFIYYPNIDVSAHVFGVNSDEWNKELIKFEEKPTNEYLVSMGIYMMSKNNLAYIPKNTFFGFDHLMNTLIDRKLLPYIYEFDGYWLDIGRPDDYEKAINDNEVKSFLK